MNFVNYTNDSILLAIGILGLIPAIELIYKWNKSKIPAYLYFSMVFFLSTIHTFSAIMTDISNNLFYWQIAYLSRNFTYFIFFIHNIKMLWKKTPGIIYYTGIIYFAVIQFLILLWTRLDNGAGLIRSDGMIIYSTEQRILGNIFQIYVAVIFIYAYFQVRTRRKIKKISNTIIIMRIMGVTLLISRLVRFVQNFGYLKGGSEPSIDRIGLIVLLIGFLLMAYVISRRETIFLSRVELEGLLVIANSGNPMASIKFGTAKSTISSTLIAGVITAIQNVVFSLDSQKYGVQVIETGALHITLEEYKGNMYVLITRTPPTAILMSSLQYFTRLFASQKKEEIDNFNKKGLIIQDLSNEIYEAFPYTNIEKISTWL